MNSTRTMLAAILSSDLRQKLEKLTLEELSVEYQYTMDPPYLAMAFDKVFMLIRRVSGKYITIEDSEVASIALICLDKCLQLFDPSQNNKFTSFYVRCLENEFKRKIISDNNEKRIANLDTQQVDDKLIGKFDVDQELYQLIPNGFLSSREFKICELLVDGFNLTEIAKELGLSQTRTWKLKNAIAAKLSQLIG